MLERDSNVTANHHPEPAHEAGQIGTPVDTDALVVPQRVALRRLVLGRPKVRAFSYPVGRQDCIVWTSPAMSPIERHAPDEFGSLRGRSQGQVRLVRPSPAMLDAFLRLADAPGDRIRDYAAAWGPLAICRHGKPCTHNPFTSQRQLDPSAPDLCAPLGWNGKRGIEPVEAWRRYSRLARTIVAVSGQLGRGDTPEPAMLWDLRRLGTPGRAHVPTPAGANSELQRLAWPLLVAAINTWLMDGDMRPQMMLQSRRHGFHPLVRLASPWWCGTPSWGLFGTLGMMLANAVATTSHAICDGCGEPYRPKRMPAASRMRFCKKCRENGTADRVRQRQWRNGKGARR